MNTPETHTSAVPEGYVLVPHSTEKQQGYLVPQFILPDLLQSFQVHREKTKMETTMVERKVGILFRDCGRPDAGTGLSSSQVHNRPFVEIAEEHIRVPPNPYSSNIDKDLSNEERLNIHAEVIATMDRLGASYKDAANRLYLAEVAKLKTVDLHKKGLANESQRMQKALIEFERKYRDHVHTNMSATDADFGIRTSDMALSGKNATGAPEYDGKGKGKGKGKGRIV
ncbi:hypothetical protein CVT25_015015 [Psilocybe cyanescens]|uniref:Uncharacterized protein n=1 Tax=Psilocybe cyanescens TaxID=93625 RepID=A0A409XAD6_PSICY|nr:hypothetical protein CVT25_015015 [Psilocybe cyanescens]